MFFLTDPIGIVDSFHSFFPSILNADSSCNIKRTRDMVGVSVRAVHACVHAPFEVVMPACPP